MFMKRMLFAELDIETINKKAVIEWIESIPKKYWFWNSYRHCELLCLMTKNGGWKELDLIFKLLFQRGCFFN